MNTNQLNTTPTEHTLNASPTRMHALREATRLGHARVEAVLPLLEAGMTMERYARVLEAFFGYYAPLEPLLARTAGADGQAVAIDRREKLPLLIADLTVLGKTSADLEALPRCTELPRVAHASHALGVLYVLEGATLGGQIICRHLSKQLRIDAQSGAAFFSGYGERTRAMWADFSQHVDRSSSLETPALLGAAVETFDTLETWLSVSLARA